MNDSTITPFRQERAPATFQLPMPTTAQEAMELANTIANSDLVPKDYKGKPGNVLIAMQMGGELGMPMMQSFQNIAVINGRPAVWGDALPAICMGHPKWEGMTETFDPSTNTATCVVKRRGEEPHTVTFSQADAVTANLWCKAGPWTTSPKRMLQMRARGFAVRDKFPDALRGIQVAEEAMDIPPEKDITGAATHTPAHELASKQQAPERGTSAVSTKLAQKNQENQQEAIAQAECSVSLEDFEKALADATTPPELMKAVEMAANLPEGCKDAATKMYQVRLSELRELSQTPSE